MEVFWTLTPTEEVVGSVAGVESSIAKGRDL